MADNDIFSLIKSDHRKVESLFKKIEDTGERATQTREKIYDDIRLELTNHSMAEEKLLYPLLKEEEESEEIAYESVEEHGLVKYMLGKLDKSSADSEEFFARITVLKEMVQHHVEEEEGEMFKKMEKLFDDEELDELAMKWTEFKENLKSKGSAAA